MKIDVEGSELNLLEGGRHYIYRNKEALVLQIELYDFQYEETASYLNTFFLRHYRCVYNQTTQKLEFLDAKHNDIGLDKDYLSNPPTYIFTNTNIRS